MRIFITGGAGYIGSVLVKELLSLKNEVIVLDNFRFNQSSLFQFCGDKNFTIVNGDCRDEKLIVSCLKGVDIIIPLAAIVGAPACESDKVAAQTINLGAIETLIRLSNNNQVIIYPCTNSGYGLGTGSIKCDENTPMSPISLYGQTKVRAEQIILARGNSITLRLATVFGVSPSMRFDLLVNNFVYRAVMDGYIILYEPHFVRNYIHIKDVARAFLFCISNFGQMKGESYNVGLSDANLSKEGLCQEIKKIIPDFYFVSHPIAKDIDQRNYIVSNEKIEAKGFHPKYSIGYGIREIRQCVQQLNVLKSQGNTPMRMG